MKLSVRGASYEDLPPVLEVTEGEIVGRNWGQNGTLPYVRHIPVPAPTLNLRQRGVSYRTSPTTAAEGTVAVREFREMPLWAATVSDRKWSSDKNPQHTQDELDKIHQSNIYRSLEHRLQVARAKRDKKLLRLLEAESEQLGFRPSTSALASSTPARHLKAEVGSPKRLPIKAVSGLVELTASTLK